MDDWRQREAVNGAVFRDMNEWTEAVSDARFGLDRPIDAYLCECSDASCTQSISVTRTEYEAVRAVPIHFVMAVNHENPEIERVASENLRFATVERCFGIGDRIARATNPRR